MDLRQAYLAASKADTEARQAYATASSRHAAGEVSWEEMQATFRASLHTDAAQAAAYDALLEYEIKSGGSLTIPRL